VLNDTAEAVPPGGWMEPTGAITADGAARVRKATRGGLAGLVNGQVPIQPGARGRGTPPWEEHVALGVHPSDAVGAGSTLGPAAGDWYCRVGRPGFRPVGPAFAGFVPAVADGGGAGTGAALIRVRQTGPTPGSGGTFTAGVVQEFNASGSWVDGTEAVVFAPAHLGMRQVFNTAWMCVDTGTVNADTPPKRRLRGVVPPFVARTFVVGVDLATCTVTTAVEYVPDVL
jgi:hypothetical protein